MSQIKLTRNAHGEHMMCTRVYTLVQTSLYISTGDVVVGNGAIHISTGDGMVGYGVVDTYCEGY